VEAPGRYTGGITARLLLDPWSPDYETPVAFDGEVSAGFRGEVDVRVESAEWVAVGPGETPGWSPVRVCFVDGVRRVEARVMADDGGHMVHGLLASVGVGAVVCQEGSRAVYDAIRVSRYLLTGSGRSVAMDACGLWFEPQTVAGSMPEDLVNAMQQIMRTREAELSASLFADADTCVFADGPLSYHTLATHRITGIIKRIFLPYLDSEHMALVMRLETGERTPVFAIRDGKYDRYSWFQRLAGQRATEHAMAGIVRLEVRASLGLEAAVEIASFAAPTLCLYASSAVRDGRAPQNLLPVGALEDELRHRLGDAVLVRRAIEQAIAEGVSL